MKRRALEVLDAGSDALAWTEAGKNKRRAAVLAALGRNLRTSPPRARRPRQRKEVVVPAHGIASPDGSAHASAFLVGNLAQVMIEIPSLGGGGEVFATECAHDDIQLRWLDEATLEISYPAAARVMTAPHHDPKTFYLSGRSIALRYKKRRS